MIFPLKNPQIDSTQANNDTDPPCRDLVCTYIIGWKLFFAVLEYRYDVLENNLDVLELVFDVMEGVPAVTENNSGERKG
ncbi:hypothetical protein DMA11_07205 [Marinilabiliaceae bacterium JC017]|nr:hypothetical protein DMA11_07205 [Marinilabiliaceae bacterium JC017]